MSVSLSCMSSASSSLISIKQSISPLLIRSLSPHSSKNTSIDFSVLTTQASSSSFHYFRCQVTVQVQKRELWTGVGKEDICDLDLAISNGQVTLSHKSYNSSPLIHSEFSLLTLSRFRLYRLTDLFSRSPLFISLISSPAPLFSSH